MKQLKEEYLNLESMELARSCSRIAGDNKAEDVVVLDVRNMSSFTDFFVIMSGRSTRHVQALAEGLENELRSKRIKTARAEGLQEGMSSSMCSTASRGTFMILKGSGTMPPALKRFKLNRARKTENGLS